MTAQLVDPLVISSEVVVSQDLAALSDSLAHMLSLAFLENKEWDQAHMAQMEALALALGVHRPTQMISFS